MASQTKIASGLIIFRRLASEIQYLMLQAANGEYHWSPPKGGVDAGETELQAAVRETVEETGVPAEKLHIYQEFKSVLNYHAWGKPKRVVYLLSEVQDPSVKVTLSGEHKDWKWVNFQEAMNIAQYDNLKQALIEANDYIQVKTASS